MAAKYFLALLVACAAVQVIYGFPNFGDIINKMKDEVQDVVKEVKEKVKSMEDKVKDIWNNMKGKADNIWDEIKKKIQDALSGAKQQLNDMQLDAKTDGAKDCLSQAKDDLSKAEAEVEPKIKACVEQVKNDMEPMVSDIKKQIDDIAPKMSDEVKNCMQMSDIMKCIQGATELAPDMKTAMQNMFGDAGKMAQLLPTEAQKARECAAPIFSDIKDKAQGILTNAANCVKQAIGA